MENKQDLVGVPMFASHEQMLCLIRVWTKELGMICFPGRKRNWEDCTYLPIKWLVTNYRNGLAGKEEFEDEDFLVTLNLKKLYSLRKSLTVLTPSPQTTPSGSSISSSSFCFPIKPHPLPSPSVCNAVMTDLMARLGEFRFAIINSPISAGLKLAPFWKISCTWGNSLCSFTPR